MIQFYLKQAKWSHIGVEHQTTTGFLSGQPITPYFCSPFFNICSLLFAMSRYTQLTFTDVLEVEYLASADKQSFQHIHFR